MALAARAPVDLEAAPGAAPSVRPWAWVPTLYLAMGTPMITVSVVAAIMYKNLGLSNSEIALYTGSMYLPWVLKPLWAPLLELFLTKRLFVLAMEFCIALTLCCVGLALGLSSYLAATLAFLWLVGFASATQDIAADGVYIAAMSPKQQAQFVGVQGICWNAGRLLASGVMVECTAFLHRDLSLSWQATWSLVMFALALVMASLGLWHVRALPRDEPTERNTESLHAALSTMRDTWLSFLQKRDIWLMLAVVFFYRFGEGFIEKVGPLFLMDARSAGGLGLDNAALGRINGGYATVGFLSGTLLGGLFAAKLTLRRSFWLLAIALNVPHLTYFLLALHKPESHALIATVVTIEKFGYGFGSVGHMLYMMQQVAPGPYRTAHYAFATGVMGLCMMLTGMVSGALQEQLGYVQFFALALGASVPPIVLAWLAPFSASENVR
jgi:MFS transporter, PAT family, beta-lactamase induction signal transducer AmpG